MLANDPTLTTVWLDLPCTRMDDMLERAAGALHSATHIAKLYFRLNVFTAMRRDLDSIEGAKLVVPFSDWMETSASLSVLSFYGSNRIRTVTPNLLSRFIPAISSRVAKGRDTLKSLTLASLDVNASDIASLIGHAGLEVFGMLYCTIRAGSFATEEQAIHQVAQSFGMNSSILELSLGLGDESEKYFCAILAALQSNSSLKTLSIVTEASGNISRVGLTAIVNLLGSSVCAVGNLCFVGFDWNDDVFAEIAHSICASPRRIVSLKFLDCRFHSAACYGLRSIYSQGSCPVVLQLSGHVGFQGDDKRVLTDIIGSSPGLRDLHMSRLLVDSRVQSSGTPFQAVIRGLLSESCAVKRLQLEHIDQEEFPAFVEAIANFRKVEYVSFPFADEQMKDKLMASFWRNRTLLEATVLGDSLGASDRARMIAFHQRNRHLCTLIHAQADAMKSSDSRGLGLLLPSLFCVSLDATTGIGQGNIFDALLRSGESLGPVATFSGKRSKPT
jgi:hypothetical protein